MCHPLGHRILTASLVAVAVASSGAVLCGCIGGPEPLSPDEALAEAAERINSILAEEPADVSSRAPFDLSETPDDPSAIVFWYYSHPLIGTALADPGKMEAFEGAYPGVTVKKQFIGEWHYAVQKLAVSLAAGDLPDVAVVKRGWLGPLVTSGRIVPLDLILPAALIDDLRAPFREALTVDGHLYAFPADGFCSVLFYNLDHIGSNPPKTWTDLREKANAARTTDSPQEFYPIGAFPFLEGLWSAGGRVCEGKRSTLDGAAARDTLGLFLELRDAGLLEPHLVMAPAPAFDLFLSGRVAMTVASSESLPRCKGRPFTAGVCAVPGRDGPVSRVSDNVIVVFAKYAEPKREGIAGLLDFLTGPHVQGAQALAQGSSPVRRSVADALDLGASGVEQARMAARYPPLRPSWSAIEAELHRYVELAYRWRPEEP